MRRMALLIGGQVMDPDQALESIFKYIHEGHEATTAQDAEYSYVLAIEHFEALDAWLRMGGYLPQKWESATRQQTF